MKVLNRALKIGGEIVKIGTPVVKVLEFNVANDVISCEGATSPTAGDRGYAAGCFFYNTAKNLTCVNTGSKTACAFRVLVPTVSGDQTALAKTGDYTVLTTDAEKILTNTGASGTVVFTLPTAASMAGKALGFHVLAAQIVRLLPVTGEAVCLASAVVVTKYLNVAGVIGNYVEVVSDGTAWLVTKRDGVVTKEA